MCSITSDIFVGSNKRNLSSIIDENDNHTGILCEDIPRENILKNITPNHRAVVVGINYILSPQITLRGCCNDAALFANLLVNRYQFNPIDIVLLVDAYPNKMYCSPKDHLNIDHEENEFVISKDKQPTRRNILLALNWLMSNTSSDDNLVFFFAGHGIQLDNISGWANEGYDEAFLPMDFYGNEINAITTLMLRDIMLNVSENVQLTIIIDANGGQTIFDPFRTDTGVYIKGIKQKDANYNLSVWNHPCIMKKRGALPRFIPKMDIESTQICLDPILQKATDQFNRKLRGYLFVSAPWSQCSIEAKFPPLLINVLNQRSSNSFLNNNVYHGVFTWCLVNSIEEYFTLNLGSNYNISYRYLLNQIHKTIQSCKLSINGLPKLDQIPELTFLNGTGASPKDCFLISDPNTLINRNCTHPDIPTLAEYLSIWEAEEFCTNLNIKNTLIKIPPKQIINYFKHSVDIIRDNNLKYIKSMNLTHNNFSANNHKELCTSLSNTNELCRKYSFCNSSILSAKGSGNFNRVGTLNPSAINTNL